MLLSRNATVQVCHVFTKDLASHTRKAEILVVAAGVPALIKKEMVRPGAIVFDVGINQVGDKTVGDVDFEAVRDIASAITPVPGGVGPLTVAMLLSQTIFAAESQMI
jgi:methylenetetrahydrofolate dehydrogenase (NADP+)/methenyltetrahydrofolate cyclohydrolase